MSTTGPSAPTTVAEESCSSSPFRSSNLSSLRTSPTENFNIKDDNRKSPSENQAACLAEGRNSADWKCHAFWDREDCLDGGGDGLASWEDEGSVNFGSSTPPVQRWGSSLENLLDDKEGSDRLKLFLENRGANKDSKMMVEFWYACKGLSLIEDIPGTIEAMWAKYIRNNIIKISDATRDAIKEDRAKENFHKAIFDNAKKEVEAIMNKTIYPNFLKSEYCMVEIFGKENVYYNNELHGNDNVVASPLTTVHEDCEYRSPHYKPSVRPKCNSRLTSKNILASQLYRDNNSGTFLRRSSNFEQDHHHAGYVSGHAISLQNSEIQSLSSGNRTDQSSSYKSGDCLQPSQRQLRKGNQYMKHYAQLNKEDQCNITSLISSHVPRTMRNEIRSGPSPTTNPKEFSKVLNDKLEKVKQEMETNEKVQQSLCKLNHSENNVDEARRQHAENSLPPSLLRNKLQEKRILEDNDPNVSDQSILDNHIKSWDPTSGSPKQYVPSREAKMRHFPHLNLPQVYNPIAPCYPKNTSKGRHYMTSSAPHSSAGTPLENHPVQILPSRNFNNHGRRRERGNDTYAYFSSDSGNVADYHDGSERFLSSNFPKSRSMSDSMENQPGISDGGSSNKRRQVSGGRRPPRRPQTDFTDSGVSDSGRSAAPSTSVKRVTNWLINCSESSDKDGSRYRGGSSTRSTAHSTDAHSSTALPQKSQCSSSASNSISSALTTTTLVSVAHINQELMNMELSRDSPLGQSQTHLVHERRKNKGNGSSSSSKSNGDGGSNGSTLRKSKPTKAPSPALTVIMYHFPDESVPYVVKLRSSLVTFKMFKEHLPKKGNFRYFFKTIDQDLDCLVNLEVTDDEAEIPLYEGKVVSHMRDD